MHPFSLVLASCMFATTIVAQTTVIGTLGILDLISPSVKLSNVQSTDADSLSSHASSFWHSYTRADNFYLENYAQSYTKIALASTTSGGASSASITGGAGGTRSQLAQFQSFTDLYYDQVYALLDAPVQYLSAVHSSVTFLPSDVQYSVLSQISGVFTGYMSLATSDILHQTPARSPVTPGPSIDVAQPIVTGQPAPGSGSKATGAPAAALDRNVLTAAVIGAVAVIMVVMM